MKKACFLLLILLVFGCSEQQSINEPAPDEIYYVMEITVGQIEPESDVYSWFAFQSRIEFLCGGRRYVKIDRFDFDEKNTQIIDLLNENAYIEWPYIHFPDNLLWEYEGRKYKTMQMRIDKQEPKGGN